jgi:RecA-family ATPase
MLDYKNIVKNQYSSVNEDEPASNQDEAFERNYEIRDASYALIPHPPIDWIVEQLISEGSVNLFYGEPGVKKTFSLLPMGVCVALGKPWLGINTTACNVLIIDEESGDRRLALRLDASLRGEFGDEATPILYVSLVGFNLDKKIDAIELQELIDNTNAGLVIIDTLADIMEGDENSKQDVQPVFSTLRKVTELTGSAIVVIHHSNKKSGYRGSSAIKGALDLMIKIESEEGSNWIEFKCEKSRDTMVTTFYATAHWSGDQFYLEAAEPQEKVKPLSKSQSYVLRYLTQHGPSSIPDIQSAAYSCSANAARNAVFNLVELGKIYRTNPEEKGRGVVAVYATTKKDQENEE